MYLSHFGLNQKPFQISPDPKFLWLGETHKEALATLQYGLRDNRGFLLLAGDVGTGKTTLINEMLDNLDDTTRVVTIPDPGVEKLDFYNFLVHAFNIEKTFTTKGDFLVHFIHFLHKSYAEGKKVLIIIDEAQRLSHEMLEEIRQLSNIEKKDTKLLNIFLVGQLEIIDALNENRNRALLHRITTKYLLGPLKKSDIQDYIRFRLKVAGTEKKLFTACAVRQVISFTGCYPRLINILCDHALLSAYVKGKQKVDGNIVKDCAKDLEIQYSKPEVDNGDSALKKFFRNSIFRIGIYSILIVLVLLSFFYLFYPALIGRVSNQPFNATIPETQKAPATSPSGNIVTKIQPPTQQAPVNQIRGPDSETTGIATQPAGIPQQAIAPPPQTPAQKASPPFKEKQYTIQFAVDSNEFSVDTYALLNRIVGLVSQYEGLKIIISGHTDPRGGYDYNKRLSEFRANVVKSYFVGQGIDPARITAIGMGPDKPVAANDTLEGRRANRRVEIQLKAES